VLLFVTGSDGAFTRTPESTTLIPGTLLRLNCGTNLSAANPAEWEFKAVGSNVARAITSNGVVTVQFGELFHIDSSSKYDLVAHTSNANESYCGTYTCYEGGSQSSGASVASKCRPTYRVGQNRLFYTFVIPIVYLAKGLIKS